MDSSDATVAASLKEVEKALGVKPTKIEPAPAPAPTPKAPMMPPGMPSDPAEVDKMLDQITPEQMKQQAEMLENMDPATLSSMAPHLGGVNADQLKMVSGMMKNMDPEQMKSMAKMAQQMQSSGMVPPGMPGMGGGGSSSSVASGGESSVAAGSGGMPGGLPDMSDMSMEKGMEMMDNMNPDMMKAGMEMMKNMDPKMMANMSKMMGREISEDQMKQMQGMMDKMSPEDLQKWSSRAAKVAGWAKGPMKVYQACRGYVARLGASGMLAIVAGMLAVMAVGHFTDTF